MAHDKYVNWVRISPGDKNKLVATASHDRSIKIWQAKDLSLKITLKGHKRSVWDLAFSPYERILASASGDKTIKLWSVSNGQCLNTLEGHVNSTVKVIWIKNGLQLFSASSDGTWKIWNIKKSTCVNTFDKHDDKIWAMDFHENKLITGGSDSKLIEWEDVTKELEEEEYKIKAEKTKEEYLLSSMIYEGKYKEAAIQAFKLKKNRDLFKVIEILLDKTKKNQVKDPIMAVLDNNSVFEKQFLNSDKITNLKLDNKESELSIKEIVKEMLNIDSLRLLEIIRDLNVHQRYWSIAQILMLQVFKILGLSKFIDFTEKQFRSSDNDTNETSIKLMGRKELISKIKDYLTIITFYSQKHYSRIERHQKLAHLVSLIVSKFTLQEEKQNLKEKFAKSIRKRDAKASMKENDD